MKCNSRAVNEDPARSRCATFALCCLALLPASVALGATDPGDVPLRIQDQNLVIELDRATALLRVEDRRAHRVYQQFNPAGPSTFHIVPRSASGQTGTSVTRTRITAVLQGPIEITWKLELGPYAGDLTATLSSDPATPLRQELGFPYPFDVQPARDWHLINRREGIILPVEDPIFFESLRRSNQQNEWGDQWGADESTQMMNWFGTTDLTSGLAVVNKTGFDARLSLRWLEKPRRFVGAFVWKPSLGRFGYDRVLLYHFSATNGYLPLTKRVRRYYVEETPWITLREKSAQLAQLDRMIGAVDIWIWRDTPYRVDQMAQADVSQMPADPLNGADFVRELHAAGVDKALLAFSVGRNDSPAYQYPKTPDEQRISRELIDEADRLGYLPLVYDNYTVPSDRRWDAATVKRITIYNADGTPYLAPNRKTNIFYPWIIDRARDEVQAHLAALPMRARFFDTLPARPLVEAYQPGRAPADRAEMARGKRDFALMLSGDLRLVLGGENISSFMVPYLHYNEGTMTMSGFMGKSESANKGYIDWPIDPLATRYGMNEFYRLPLFELVFHDAIVSTWHWRTENHKSAQLWQRHDLFNILYGTMPLWNLKPALWRDYKEQFVASYRNVCTNVFAKVGYDELLSHRWLTPDRKVQESVFASGLRVTVNFSDETYRTAAGGTIAPASYLTETINKKGGP